MNLQALAVFTSDTLTTVKCFYDSSPTKLPSRGNPADVMAVGASRSKYTFVCDTELAKTLKAGGLVLARSKNGIQLITVAEIDEEPDVDLNADYAFSFVFQKVDASICDKLEADLAELVKTLKIEQRKQLRQSVLAQLEEGKLQLTEQGKVRF